MIENSSQFQVLAVNELGEEVVTTPAPTGRDLFVRTDRHLVRIAGGIDAVSRAPHADADCSRQGTVCECFADFR